MTDLSKLTAIVEDLRRDAIAAERELTRDEEQAPRVFVSIEPKAREAWLRRALLKRQQNMALLDALAEIDGRIDNLRCDEEEGL